MRKMDSVDAGILNAFQVIARTANNETKLFKAHRSTDARLRNIVQYIRTHCDAIDARLSIEDTE